MIRSEAMQVRPPGAVKGKRTIWWLTVLGCGLFAVDDISVLRSFGGGLLASPSWIPILFAAWLASREGLCLPRRQQRLLLAVFTYGAVITVFSLPFLSDDLLGENPLVKSIKFVVSVGVFLLMLVAGAVLAKVVPKAIQFGCLVAVILMAGGAILYHLGNFAVDQTALLHSYPNFQLRVRSTRFEASSLGSGLLVCLGLFFLFMKKKRAVLGISLGLIAAGLLAESRGTTLTVIVVLAAVPVGLWLQSIRGQISDRATRFWTYLVAAISIILSFRLDYFLGSPVWSALGLKTEGTSDASRSTWADASLAAIFEYPFGMGYAAYLERLPELVSNSARAAMDRFPVKDLSEMINLSMAANDATLSPKNLVGVAAVHLGLVGVCAVFLLYSAVLRAAVLSVPNGDYGRFVIAALTIVLTSSYYSSIFSYDQAFLLGALVLVVENRSHKWNNKQNFAPNFSSRAERGLVT